MTEAETTLVTNRANRKLHNPDDLDDYVRVTSPMIWALLAGIVAVLAAFFAWSIFGTVTTNVSTTGIVFDLSEYTDPIAESFEIDDYLSQQNNRMVMCFLSAQDVKHVEAGDMAEVGGVPMKVYQVSSGPASPSDWDDLLGSKYLVGALFNDDWAYPVWFEGDSSQLEAEVPLATTITSEQIRPISLVLGS